MQKEVAAKREQAMAEVAAAQASVLVARANVELAETIWHFAKVVAPFDGVVIKRGVHTGNLAGPPASSKSGPLFTVARIDKVRVVVQIPEANVGGVFKGTEATVRVPTLNGKVFKGSVARIAGALDKKQTLRAEIDLANAEGRLMPGMSAVVVLVPEADGPKKKELP
jgi:RND family efflux transporter MFP subunit